MRNIFKKWWGWFLGIMVASAFASTLPLGVPPVAHISGELLLKVPPGQIREHVVDGGIVQYKWRSARSYGRDMYNGKDEVMEWRRPDSQYFRSGKNKDGEDEYIERQWIADVIDQDVTTGQWYWLDSATTTLDAYNAQVNTVSRVFWRAVAMALTDTSSTNNGDDSIRSGLDDNISTNTTNYLSAQTGNLYYPLFKWTLSSGSGTISSIKHFMYKFDNSGTASFNIGVHQILRTDFDPATCTWTKYKTATTWTTAGAEGAGTDYNSTPLSSVARITSTGVYQNWDITSYPGITWGSTIYLKFKPDATFATSDFFQYNSKEAASNLPYLEITYTSAATGYSHKANGIIPSKVNGVPLSSTSKINGI